MFILLLSLSCVSRIKELRYDIYIENLMENLKKNHFTKLN